MSDTPEDRIQVLEAELRVMRFLNSDFHKTHKEWEHALRMYAAGEKGPSYARKVLGIGEYWDAGYGGWFLRTRRVFRRLKEWWSKER